MRELWGPSRNLDYWAALREGSVEPEERRAVALLASMTDERRFSAYCVTGRLAAMGNVTKRIYLIRRHSTVLELEDGRPKTSWCINGPDRYDIPETDHVVLMRNLIEGEELAFRMTGNPGDASWGARPQGERIRTPFMSEMLGAPAEGNAGFTDLMDMHRARTGFVERKKSEREGRLAELTLRKRMWDAAARAGRRRPDKDAGGMQMGDQAMGCEPPGGIEIGNVLNGPFGYVFPTMRFSDNTSGACTASSLTNNNIHIMANACTVGG